MLSSPSRILTYIDRSILWKHPTLLPVLTTPAAVILVLVGGADLMVPGGPGAAPSRWGAWPSTRTRSLTTA
ncbi:hypothetical protein EDB84DRAFT_1538194, partial [Lactarius hengduanensis]